MKEIQYGNLDFLQPQNAWEALSQKEKADVMKVAVRRGITDLATIRQMYNEFAEGGNLYGTGGNTEAEALKVPSLNESKRLGVMVGVAPFVRPKGYIGGSQAETRDKYWQMDNEMRLLTDSVANEYGINPDLLRSRMDQEGYTDTRIAEINKDVKKGTNRALTGEALFHSEAMPYVAGEEFGLDDTATYINNGTVNLINENWSDAQGQNEKGRWTNLAAGHNYSDNVGIMAATLKAFRELAKKDFPWASDADLDRYAQAYYNRGIAGGKKWVQNGAKGYKVTKHAEGGNLYDGGGYVYDVLPKLMRDAGLDVRVTSGYREPGKVGKAGSKSWHGRHGAVDIVPHGKTTFEDIEDAIYNNPVISNYMLSNGFGLIDESGRSKESRDTMKRTGATGAHFHIGKDSTYAKRYADRMAELAKASQTPIAPAVSTAVYNPYIFQQQATLPYPEVVSTPTTLPAFPSEVELEYQRKQQEAAENRYRFNMAMNVLKLLNREQDPAESFLQNFMPNPSIPLFEGLPEDQYAHGGGIHIKKSHRGKFTRLKERTGKSASWYKAHGTPEQRKMATFELNARKWKHADGGHLYGGGGLTNVILGPRPGVTDNEDVRGILSWLPYTSTAIDIDNAAKNPSAANLTWAGISTGLDALSFGLASKIKKGIKAVEKAIAPAEKEAAAATKRAERAKKVYEQAPTHKNYELNLKAEREAFEKNYVLNNQVNGLYKQLADEQWHKSTWLPIMEGHGGIASQGAQTIYEGANTPQKALGGNLFAPGGNITYGAPHYLYDENGQMVRDENEKPYINYNATLPDIVITPEEGILNKGMNYSSNPTVGYAARKAGEDAVREKQEKAAELAERFNRQNEMHSLFPTKEISGETVFESKDGPKVIGMSGADPIGEAIVMGEALSPFLKAIPGVYGTGRRFVQNVGDRYQGMIDAADYAASKEINAGNAADITNFIWRNRQGDIASGNSMIAVDGGYSAYKSPVGKPGVTTSPGGNQTINVHLGGERYGDKPWQLNPMGVTKGKWVSQYLDSAPKGTIFGEVGRTKNFAEQYTDVNPSLFQAVKDAYHGKLEANPAWDAYEKEVVRRIGEASDPEVVAYYQNMLNGNSPLSVDSYKMMLDMAGKGKYDLRYDSKPMGLFNNQGYHQKDFYESLLPLSPEEQMRAVNSWIEGINPNARSAYLENGEIQIPRPMLKKKTPSNNSWLRKKK